MRISKYAKKHAEQARGKFRKTSPFYLPPSERAAAIWSMSLGDFAVAIADAKRRRAN